MDRDLETAKTIALIAVIFNLLGLVFSIFILFLAILPFIFMLLDYLLVYEPLTKGDGERAETPALILGIIQVIPFIGGVIPGLLLIFTWIKIRDSANRRAAGSS